MDADIFRELFTELNTSKGSHMHTGEYKHERQCRDAGSVTVGGCGCLKCVCLFPPV